MEAGQLTVRGHAADAPSIRSTPSRWAMADRGLAGNGTLTVLALFLPPALMLFTLFVVLPIGEAAWYSTFNWNGFGRPVNWIGLDNYRLFLGTRGVLVGVPHHRRSIAASLV